jgi:hypothetical protein
MKVLSEIEWRRRDRQWIAEKGSLAEARGKPIFLERQWRQGWNGPLAVYLLWCPDCRLHTITHPAGYGRINCRGCRYAARVMTWQRFRDKQAKPLLFWFPRLMLPILIVILLVLLVTRH